jgi:high-affinity iron transporter
VSAPSAVVTLAWRALLKIKHVPFQLFDVTVTPIMFTLLFQMQAPMDMVIGAVGGMAVAAFVASLWSRFGHRVNLALFFQVTAVFLMIFVVQLLIYGFHELTEANIFPYSEPLHIATEPYGPDGLYGRYLTYLLVLMPMGWLAFASMFGARKAIPSQTPAQVN